MVAYSNGMPKCCIIGMQTVSCVTHAEASSIGSGEQTSDFYFFHKCLLTS